MVRGIYVAILFAYSSKAYFAKAAISGDWRAVCNIALGGMLLELVFTLLVKRLNIIAFVTRGLIGKLDSHLYFSSKLLMRSFSFLRDNSG